MTNKQGAKRELPETEIRSDDHCTCPGRCMHAGWTYTSAPMHRTRAFIPILAHSQEEEGEKGMDGGKHPATTPRFFPRGPPFVQ